MSINKGIESKSVRRIWKRFVREFGSEIAVLVDVPIEELAKVHEEVAKAIWAYRNGKLIIIPGGGGKYGEIKLPDELKNAKIENLESLSINLREESIKPKQTSILNFLK